MDVKGWTEGWMDGGRERQAGTEAWQTGLMTENSTSIEIPSFLARRPFCEQQGSKVRGAGEKRGVEY